MLTRELRAKKFRRAWLSNMKTAMVRQEASMPRLRTGFMRHPPRAK